MQIEACGVADRALGIAQAELDLSARLRLGDEEEVVPAPS